MKSNLRYCGFPVRVATWNFGTSGTTFRIIAQTEAGRDRKDGKEWRFRYDPSANSGHGAVVENTLDRNEHVIYTDPASGAEIDYCPSAACPNVGEPVMTCYKRGPRLRYASNR